MHDVQIFYAKVFKIVVTISMMAFFALFLPIFFHVCCPTIAPEPYSTYVYLLVFDHWFIAAPIALIFTLILCDISSFLWYPALLWRSTESLGSEFCQMVDKAHINQLAHYHRSPGAGLDSKYIMEEMLRRTTTPAATYALMIRFFKQRFSPPPVRHYNERSISSFPPFAIFYQSAAYNVLQVAHVNEKKRTILLTAIADLAFWRETAVVREYYKNQGPFAARCCIALSCKEMVSFLAREYKSLIFEVFAFALLYLDQYNRIREYNFVMESPTGFSEYNCVMESAAHLLTLTEHFGFTQDECNWLRILIRRCELTLEYIDMWCLLVWTRPDTPKPARLTHHQMAKAKLEELARLPSTLPIHLPVGYYEGWFQKLADELANILAPPAKPIPQPPQLPREQEPLPVHGPDPASAPPKVAPPPQPVSVPVPKVEPVPEAFMLINAITGTFDKFERFPQQYMSDILRDLRDRHELNDNQHIVVFTAIDGKVREFASSVKLDDIPTITVNSRKRRIELNWKINV